MWRIEIGAGIPGTGGNPSLGKLRVREVLRAAKTVIERLIQGEEDLTALPPANRYYWRGSGEGSVP